MNDLAVYVHIPFCKSKCAYCDFYSAPASVGAVRAYVEALCAQIRASDDAGASVSTVYFGGGTPSLLTPNEFSDLAAALRQTFDLSALCEWTLECNPESVAEEKVRVWRDAGVNRVSMGMQSFSDRLLSAMGRAHTAAQALCSYDVLRAAGFKNVSLDLMLALPGQTEQDVSDDLRQMIALKPEHISAYLLSVEPDSRWGQKGITEADEMLQRDFYLLTDRVLTDAGYEHYEISNFARPGYRAKHNSAYWSGADYLGFGAGAAGFRHGVRCRVPADREAFIASRGTLLPQTEEIIDKTEAAREVLFLGLRCREGIPVDRIPQKKMPLARALAARGDARFEDGRFSLTPSGFLISNQVIVSFLDEK